MFAKNAEHSAQGFGGAPEELVADCEGNALVNSGVPQLVAMSISGHETPSMFKRYNIPVEDEQRNALVAVEKHHAQKLAEAKATKKNVVAMAQG